METQLRHNQQQFQDTTDLNINQILSPLIHPFSFEDYFQINQTCDIINSHQYKRVALQFPDVLLSYAPQISSLISIKTNSNTFILADTSYGSCCIDEVASQHVNSDFLIHYGPSCLSKTEKTLPIYHVFGKKQLDLDSLSNFCELYIAKNKQLVVMYDVAYHHLLSNMMNYLKEIGFDVVSSDIQLFHDKQSTHDELSSFDKLEIKDQSKDRNSFNEITLEPDARNNSNILYIGKDSPTLIYLLMVYSQTKIYSFDPTQREGMLESPKKNNLLLKRYAKIDACLKSNTIALIVGTLGVKSYLPLIKQLKLLTRLKGKSCHVISVGKPNPAKLGNFDSVGCFVFIGCPVSTVMIGEDAKEYIKPILTPFELVVGLNSIRMSKEMDGEVEYGDLEWAPYADGQLGKYETDFTQIATRLRGISESDEILNSGQVGSTISVRGCQDMIQFGNSVSFLNQRTFQGLDMQTTVVSPASITKGRSGLARDYDGNASDQ